MIIYLKDSLGIWELHEGTYEELLTEFQKRNIEIDRTVDICEEEVIPLCGIPAITNQEGITFFIGREPDYDLYVRVGNNVKIGKNVKIGYGVVINDDIEIPDGSVINNELTLAGKGAIR